jgi:tRNA (guanine37-N1)-methyltransferase
MLSYHIITIFPEIFESFLKTSLIAKALTKKAININLIQLRDFAKPPHFQVDDLPFGGGAGMLLKPEPLAEAIKSIKLNNQNAKVIYLTPSGVPFKQKIAEEIIDHDNLIIICGRYEGIDQRIIDLYVDYEISLCDAVLMGGEIPAMALIESSARLLPGVLGNEQSLAQESFANLKLEGPQYTRPADFEGNHVPEILLSGNHANIEKWRREMSIIKTKKNRPDLL